MTDKLAELTVYTGSDYNDKVISTLEKAGFVIIKESDGFGEAKYIIGDKSKSKGGE